MSRTREKKSSSLAELGYTIKPVSTKTDSENGWRFHIKGIAPEFWIRESRRGRLIAYKSKDAKLESTIEGLYNFKEKSGDLVGQRYSVPSPKLVKTA